MAATAGMATALMGARQTLAQQTPPAQGGGGPGGPGGQRPPPPPEPTVAQPAPLKDVKGKTAYITAGSDGIGLGIARAFANAGMNVVLGYRNEERLKLALPVFKKDQQVIGVKHDVVGREGWVKLLEDVKAKFGKLHCVVNNAGVKSFAMASNAPVDVWQNGVEVNLNAIFHSVGVILPHMREHNEGGHFVTTASMSGVLPAVTAGLYTTTKFAAVGIMEALRIELEGTNIGTSAFCPGGVNTDNLPPGTRPPDANGRVRGANPSPLMDPLEAGERVLNGMRNNDLYIFSHAEFEEGLKQRFDAMLESFTDEPAPEARLALETRTRFTGIYPREIAHRKVKRKSYRT
jgi:NAD(P)-dependent dehydrogenase (short-subunit alcohol dehydrogenase family)